MKKYNFPSLKTVQPSRSDDVDEEEEVASRTKREISKTKISAAKVKTSKSRKAEYSSEESSSEASSDEDEENIPSIAHRGGLQDGQSEEDDLEAQLEQEDVQYARRKRLPELDFVLSFAHKRARELLRNSDEDDAALTTVVATWLQELEERFETFEKQAAKFDEYESALLQSQRMHQKIRKQISSLLKQEREMKMSLSETVVQNERRLKGMREQSKADQLLSILGPNT